MFPMDAVQFDNLTVKRKDRQYICALRFHQSLERLGSISREKSGNVATRKTKGLSVRSVKIFATSANIDVKLQFCPEAKQSRRE